MPSVEQTVQQTNEKCTCT